MEEHRDHASASVQTQAQPASSSRFMWITIIPCSSSSVRCRGGPLRGDDVPLAARRPLHRWPPWLAVGCGLVHAFGRVDGGEEPQRPRDGSVCVRECCGACVHWATGHLQGSDSGPFQYRPGLCRLGQGRGRGGQCADPPYRPGLGLCRYQYPLVRYNSAGVAYWVSNEPSILQGVAQRCGRALAQLKTHGV